jgi:REP-associated tyrosine transposase
MMARLPRKQLPDGLAHVTCRTIRRLPLFRTEADARGYLALLDHVTRDVTTWSVLAYCLMPNHVHLVVDSSIDQLSLAMHRVNGLYAQRFNREHGYRGHLFQGRFYAKPIRDEAHLPGSIRYVLLNPVRANLCAHPQQWRWSSYRACAGLEPARSCLDLERTLAYFEADPDLATTRFCQFVQDGLERSTERGQAPGLSPSLAAATPG